MNSESNQFMMTLLSKFEATSVDGQPLFNPFKSCPLLSTQFSQAPPAKKPYRAGWKLIENPKKNLTELESVNGKRKFDKISNKHSPITETCSDNMENIEKRVKIADGEERALSEVSTICTSPQSVFESKLSDAEINLEFNSEIISNNVAKKEIKMPKSIKKEKKILYSCFNKEENKILFKVENEGEGIESVTRKEILEEDPYLLLYFYEKHLKFAKSNNFDAEMLKKF